MKTLLKHFLCEGETETRRKVSAAALTRIITSCAKLRGRIRSINSEQIDWEASEQWALK